MSPASSGTLEVEKYIGACLISQNRPKSTNTRDVLFSRDRYLPEIYPGNYANFDGRFRQQRCNSADRWAGGMPLISFVNQRRGSNRRIEQHDVRITRPEDTHNPLARLAVHTQGAPLIVTKTYNNRKKTQKTPTKVCDTSSSKLKIGSPNCNETQNLVGVDAVSVTSDESSGSANSDNYLPRIIKPRKRRKKDRKPPILGRPLSHDGFSTDSASPDIDANTGIHPLRPNVPFVFDPNTYRLVPEDLPLISNKRSDDQFQFYDVSEAPQLHHRFEDVEELDDGVDINGNQSTTICQCRYCDPSGQIWDVDRNCYSPFLTAPVHGSAFKFPDLKLQNFAKRTQTHSDLDNNYCLIHSMSSVSLEDEKEQKNRKISGISRDLEVSTEIVTSLNGHRDLEIKFFSSPSTESVRTSLRTSVENTDVKLCGKLCEKETNPCVNKECRYVSEE